MNDGTRRPVPPTPAAARTARMLDGPIVPTLVRLALPNVAMLVAQSVLSAAETYYVGLLGTDALAGAALVFPFVMIMQMMSAGALGGGIAGSIARALGGGRHTDAAQLAGHALLIVTVLGIIFTLAMLAYGDRVFLALGARDGVLEAAVALSDAMFAGMLMVWLCNGMASVLRGTGDMMWPALTLGLGAPVAIALSPVLIFGIGPLPAFGIAGAGMAFAIYYGLSMVVLAVRLMSGGGLKPALPGWRPRRRTLADILAVGLPAMIHVLLINLTVVTVTRLLEPYGVAALAGYGIGARLEYMQIPIVFGLGTAMVAMVGTNVGAGRMRRAFAIGLAGGLMSAVVSGAIGLAVAIHPPLWAGLFTDDPAALAAAAAYLTVVGPFYFFLGLGMASYFASQGLRRMTWPLTVATLRVMVTALGGYAGGQAFGLTGTFAGVAAALTLFGLLNILPMVLGLRREA
jgi:putative MATE family efflux protein